MLTKTEALNIVSKRLEQMNASADPFVVVEKSTIEKPFGWIFFYNSKRFVDTGEFRYRLAGNGPVIVNKQNGSVEFLGSARPPQELVAEYEQRLASGREEFGTLIVTGASRGIGAAIASVAAERGYSVALNFHVGEAEAQEVVSQIISSGRRAVAIQGDVGREEDVMRLFTTAESELGPVKALVNNAAITGGFARVEAVSAKALADVMAVNVCGAILCAREAVRRMSTRHGGNGGAIVNISSRAAHTGSPGEWVHYAASKGAIDSFTIGLAREVATEGIRVNAVAPGLVDTGLHAANGEPGRLQRLMPTIPMQRAGMPREVAEAVLWLLSPAASYVTGAILEVGGGR